MYFHAIIAKKSPFDPEKDVVVLKSKALFQSPEHNAAMQLRYDLLVFMSLMHFTLQTK